MTIAAIVLSAAQTAAKSVFAPTSVGRFLKVVALPGAKHLATGIYFVESHRGIRGCNGNSWLLLADNECGKVELGWREAVFSEIATAEVVTKVADMAKFFAPCEAVVTGSVEVSVPAILDPVSTALEAPALNLSV